MWVNCWNQPEADHVSVRNDNRYHRQASDAMKEKHFFGWRTCHWHNCTGVRVGGEWSQQENLCEFEVFTNDVVTRAECHQNDDCYEKYSESRTNTSDKINFTTKLFFKFNRWSVFIGQCSKLSENKIFYRILFLTLDMQHLSSTYAADVSRTVDDPSERFSVVQNKFWS